MNNELHFLLINEMQKKIPKKSDLANFLMDLLNIEKETAYRRLRGNIPFSLQEASKIAQKLAISMDELIGVECDKMFRIKLPDFVDLQTEDIRMFSDFLDFLETISQMEITETGVVSHALPAEIFSISELIIKLNIFRWHYYSDYAKRISFEDLYVSPLVIDNFKKQFSLSKNFKNTSYIIDQRVFIRLIKELKYFEEIALIDDKSIVKIKEELLYVLDYLEELSLTGEFKETGNSVNLYITDMEIPFSCAHIKANDVEYTLLKTYILIPVISLDKTVCQKTKDWISSSIRTSVSITNSSEIERRFYFRKQREIINSLSF